MKTLFFTYLLLIPAFGWTQTFPSKGQYPSNSFPVCGKDTIRQSAVQPGFTGSVPVPGCEPYFDTNPYYYRFICHTAGSLGFNIIPNDQADNYDWMLFDITGRIPANIYVDADMIIAGNQSGTPGQTGARAGGALTSACPSGPLENIPTFTPMPTLVAGREYLLMVTHVLDLQSGYALVFEGGTAVINDPEPPAFLSVVVQCDKKTLTVGITKFIRCNSLTADGSEFFLTNTNGIVVKAIGLNCSPQFDMNYLEVYLNDPLPPGNYSLVIRNGSDLNTLLDYCGSQISPGEKIDFTVAGDQPALDSIIPPACAPVKIQLVLTAPVLCSSIAADGTDFTITGSSPVSILGAEGNCTGSLTTIVDILLSAPIETAGDYQVLLGNGSDGNTLINDCGIFIPSGSSLSFSKQQSVSAEFQYDIAYGCRYDTISLHYQPLNGVTAWEWKLDAGPANTSLNPVFIETVFGLKKMQHIVSNGFCSDTVTETIHLDNILLADFEAPKEVCPKNISSFTNTSTGKIISYYWDFGDGTNSSLENPPGHLFPASSIETPYTVSLVVKNNEGCADTSSSQIIKLQTCSIGIPNAFTPNGDGKNDFLYPLNISSASGVEFRIFNRFGQLLFETRDGSRKWDGNYSGSPQAVGTYIWTLRYTDVSGKLFFLKGSTVLIR